MIDTEAITAAVELSGRYIHDRKNPDKSIDLIDGACAKERVKDQGNVTINKEMIMQQLSRITSIPLDRLQNERSAKIVELEFDTNRQKHFAVILSPSRPNGTQQYPTSLGAANKVEALRCRKASPLPACRKASLDPYEP
jgi:ribosomal protein L2